MQNGPELRWIRHDISNVLHGLRGTDFLTQEAVQRIERIAQGIRPGMSEENTDALRRQLQAEIHALRELSEHSTDYLDRVQDILDSHSPQLQRFPLSEVVNAQVSLYQERLLREGYVITFHSHNNPQVHADKKRIRRVLENLMRNSLDALPEGGTIDVEVLHAAATGRLGLVNRLLPGTYSILEVRDDGPGICTARGTPAAHPTAYVRRFRSTRSAERGNGLRFVCEVLKECGAEATYDHAEPHGTHARIYFPEITG